MEQIRWVLNRMPQTEDAHLPVMSLANVEKAHAFHASFPQYGVTPLRELSHMAKEMGLGGLFVKDESYRFGLNAFKVLGGSFAMARYIADQLGRDVSQVDYHY
ncbi:MAG: diaminopropionate ammonia-lyase, partial [Clostridia bacterium]